MQENLVIVESPAKAKTIEKFLGKDFLVTSSMGHIRDLEKKDFGIDIENNYLPKYVVSDDKKKIVAELKKLAKKATMVWLASDEDREGEAIAWHLKEELGLKADKTKRIVFHEITKDAILNAIQNPRNIDENLVNAQQARRVLDRIVGFELSPVLWKKVKPSLSAGRVQSVAVRLIVEREREIINFKSSSSFRVTANFQAHLSDGQTAEVKAELPRRFDTRQEAEAFLEKCKTARFTIADITRKPARRTPAPPFTTSTLQQEASRKLGFSVAQTMSVAQRLYEGGKITYMRTDSVNLSGLALNTASQKITELHGDKYVQIRQYKTKSKGAQEAHEAIRPTYIDHETISGSAQEKRLYDLIWKRTIASQMADAVLEKTTITIDISTAEEKFIASGEVIIFDGFLKVYMESSDEENGNGSPNSSDLLPPLKANDQLKARQILATERFTQKPPRYTEASLVKRLEELGIGRPSTYAPTISTIQTRNYVIREDRPGTERQFSVLELKNNTISETTKTEITGAEKSKLFPTDIGMVVNDFLIENFEQVMDYNFTANVEKEFDDIAEGKRVWNEMIDRFYHPFRQTIESTLKNSEKTKGERILGSDPKTGKQVSVKIGRFGPIAQLGESTVDGDQEKPQFASLRPSQHLETITLEEALELFKMPRELGDYENKKVTVGVGRFGPYIRHNNQFVSLPKTDDPYSVGLERAIELIEAKREKERNAVIKTFAEDADLRVLNGRWGPYIAYKKSNFRIPKGTQPETLTYEACLKLIEEGGKTQKRQKK
ncbi:MAG TPA: type I DNA topoisomerase [Prolixibacteraceae bacterium]|nr:type I DNA topoisomerase [Prolixibacteraceae bacterium]